MSNRAIDLLAARNASRAIADEPVPQDVFDDLIEAARLTPSCFNNQPWRFLFLQTEEARERGRQCLSAGNRAWAGRAPLLIIAYTRATDDCQLKDGRSYHQFDLGLAVMSIMLAATDRALIARPLAGFDPARVRELFALDASDEPLAMVAVGRQGSDESHLPPEKRGLEKQPRTRKAASEIAQVL